MSIKDQLATARLPERSLRVNLRGDLRAEWDELERQLAEARSAEQGGRRRLSSPASGASEIVERMSALEDEMAGAWLDLRVRALPRREWQALVRSHPPKPDHEGDEAMGVDLEGLMAEAIPRCVADPEMDAEDWDALDTHLSSGDYDRLLNIVWEINRSGVDVPKSRLVSLVMAEAAVDSK